jgi:3-phosphoshikimate 1-carboxyvinyltransferase
MTNRSINGTINVPGDKSITHRALIFSAFSQGKSVVRNISPALDCVNSALCLQELGMTMRLFPGGTESGGFCEIETEGPQALHPALKTLDAGNSGTTIRLLSGLCAGLPHSTLFDGDESLRRRPMARVLSYLEQMGAKVEYVGEANYPPFKIQGGELIGKHFTLPVASAQVQTAILLAGLFAQGQTSVSTPTLVRDHTARMFSYLGISHEMPDEFTLCVNSLSQPVKPFEYTVAADISSAAFFMVAASILPGSQVMLPQVGINPGRRLVIDALWRMGASIELMNERLLCNEPVADIQVTYTGDLKGITISGDVIAAGIDEIPALALAAAFSHGEFVVEGAEELKVKESNRLNAIVDNLSKAGADIKATEDGFVLVGKGALKGGDIWKSHGDHRMAMTGLVADLACLEPVAVDNTDCIGISYPDFIDDLAKLTVHRV